ncbi:uncharacterized protein LOC132740645 [Ruditapes philippinarum]|uniref:uncharacterized protein LOC132740645 n=1 Tax=Ruditapes philippinarum TaxID=129788 RepID=UPI00295BF86A|nr:uncharacterized protein LOC132740645 [Ruditapes philippinarum]
MKFKPRKSRYLVLRKGKILPHVDLKIQGEDIPRIIDNPIKCLGKWFDATLKDKEAINQLQVSLSQNLKTIDKTGLPGKFKVWIYQHSLLPRLSWPLMLYEVPTSTAESLERQINKHIRKWFGLPQCFTSLGLYTATGELQLPVSSLVEEFKVSKARLLMTLKDSPDECIRGAGIELRTGRKWSVSQAVESAESRLRHADIVGTTTVGHLGLGVVERKRYSTSSRQDRRSMIQAEIRKGEEERRMAQLVQMGSQGASTKWNLPERKLNWSDIWQMEPVRISFLLRSVYDVLPTPGNLHRWKLIDDPSCTLCGKRGTLEHVLISCSIALSQGRYRWRHDRVLRQLADTIERERK